MAEDKDYFGEKLRLAERAREDAYFRKLDQALIEQMRQKDHEAMVATAPSPEMFTSGVDDEDLDRGRKSEIQS